MKRAYEIIRSHGGLCVADEVQTGFGRSGTNYWGFQNQGVEPDIVVMGKGIVNGTPLAAVATTPEIAAHLKHKIFFNTYAGNQISCVAAMATMDYIDKHNL